MSSSSSSSSEDEDEILIEKNLESPVKPKSEKCMEDLLELRWYCLRVLWMAEVAAFTALASVTFMVFAGANPSIVGCDNYKVNNCLDLKSLQNRTGCVPKINYQFKSTQVEFNYLCEEAKKVKNTITVQTFGVLIGAAVFGQISDNIGRRKALLISTFGNAVFNVIAGFSPDLLIFMILRTVCGIFAGGMTVVQIVFMVENIPRKHRMWIQNSITWSPNLIIYPFVAYLAQDWRNLSIIVGFTSFVTFLAVLILHESPRWLVQKGKIEEARRVLNWKMKKWPRQQKRSKKYTFIHLFCTWKMLAQTLTFVTGIVCTTTIVYALMYNMEKLSGSLFWNSAWIGASRWVVNIVVSILDYKFTWFGRKIVNQLSMFFTILALGVMTSYSYYGEKGTILTVGTFIAASMCSQLFIVKYLMVNELYPTAVRNLAVSAVSTMSRIGSMFSPQLFYLADYADWIPYAVLFGLQIYDLVVFSIFIPETKGVHLENHLPPKNQRIFRGKSRQQSSSHQ
ncbi:unnamed protein product [Caenorhabditis angaria]|uniref:Major facilitator superfamily (MFS) profile domain-containing protein n=1 Tax=Caenorhabditis angaria TaxID=860376 RepID=A0A9P1IRN0_9PELO|nr:unnamed protein product [Caenorhabditis angaria]